MRMDALDGPYLNRAFFLRSMCVTGEGVDVASIDASTVGYSKGFAMGGSEQVPLINDDCATPNRWYARLRRTEFLIKLVKTLI